MVYLDTSVAVALFIPEANTARVKNWFAAALDPLVCADWIVTEFASALAIKQRRGDITATLSRAVWREFDAFRSAGLRLVPVTRTAFETAARMARDAASGLRAGDALHLAVALELGVSRLATADAVLAANAKRHGLAMVGF